MKKIVIITIIITVLAMAAFAVVSSMSTIKFFNNLKSYTFSLTKKEIVLTDISGNDTIIEFNTGRKIIHYWATTCKPCIAEFDSIRKYKDNLGNAELFLVSNESAEKVNKFVSGRFDDLPIYTSDSLNSPFTPKRINFLPTTIVVNVTIESIGVGALEWGALHYN